MPRRSILKTLLIESMLFVSLFALVAHLSVNFWERYVIQTELSHIKYSLHSMKDTVNKIGYAYDILHTDLKSLINDAEKKPPLEKSRQQELQHKDKFTLDRRRLHDIKVQAMVKAKNERIGISQANQKTITYKHIKPLTNNATTITRYALKSTAIGPDIEKGEQYSCNNKTCGRKTPKYCEDFKYCKDPHVVFQF